jgi:hypothetical protein
MGLLRAIASIGSGSSNRSGVPAEMNRRPIHGRTAHDVENLTRDGSTVREAGGSYVVTRPTGGHHRHDPNGNGTYSCSCGC